MAKQVTSNKKRNERIAEMLDHLSHGAAAIDKLDASEVSVVALQTAIALFLEKLGYQDVIARAAAFDTAKHLYPDFLRQYWQSAEYTNKITTLWAATMTAAESIEKDEVNADTRRAIAQAIEEQKRARGDEDKPKKVFRWF